MSTKFSYWLSNKEKSSKKSAGFLTGIFHLFDRRFLLGPRQHDEQHHAKSSSANTTITLCNQGADCGEIWNMEHNLSRSYQENLRSSMDSSTKTSSSSSASNSSLKHKLPKVETKSPKHSTKSRSNDINQSPDFRKSINESLYKDHKNDSVKKKTMEGVIKRNKVLKPVDSPRPIDLSKMKELEESLEILIKLRDLPNNFHEEDCSPRFSYDGRISKDITLKEKRRLSLDSMGDSARCEFKSKVSSFKKELEKKSNYRISEASNLHHDLKSNENHNSIVAKLMGLGPINSPGENCVKSDKQVKEQKKQEIMLQSASNSPKSRSSINRQTKSDSSLRLIVKETQPKMTVEPVHNVIEKTLEKLEFQQNNKEIRDLRRVLLERKNSEKISRPANKTEKSSILERSLNSPFVGKKSESKSADISPLQSAKLEGPSGLRKIKTCDSNDKKKEFLSEDGGQSPIVKTPKSLNSPTKEKIRREGDNSVSPRLQRRANPDQVRKSSAMITSYDLKKNQKQIENRQQSESVSPSSRVRQKSNKSQLNEVKSHLFHQTKGKIATNAASASKHKQNEMLPRKNIFVEELEKIAPQLSSPNSVLDDSPYHDDLSLSPLSVSSISNVEDENLSSDHNLKTILLPQDPQNLPSISKFVEDSKKQENTDTKYVAEVLFSSDLLTKNSHLSSMLKKIKLFKPLEVVEKSNTQILHKQLVYDVVNEILRRKLEAFSNGCQHDHLLEPNMLSLQLLFKELCLEIKYLQTSMDRSIQEKDTVFTKDLLRRSNGWDRFDSEVPAVVSEIERLIYIDLINEIIESLIGTVQETKQRYTRQLFV